MPRHLTLSLIVLVLVPSLARGATNLIANPRFDVGVAGWTALGGTASWSPVDELSTPGSGSLRISSLAANSTNDVISECFAVAPGVAVVFGASAFIPDPDAVQAARVKLVFWPGAGCSGSSVGVFQPGPEDHYAAASTWGSVQGNGTVPNGAVTAHLALRTSSTASPTEEVLFDNAFVYLGDSCATTATVACLNDRRFRVQAKWDIPDGTRGYAALAHFSGDSARATFFDPANVELVLKVLDACVVNERYWVFAAGLTNVEVTVRVTDTHTATVWEYHNPLDQAFPPVQDTSAFAACPH